jgi:hypothetical protein
MICVRAANDGSEQVCKAQASLSAKIGFAEFGLEQLLLCELQGLEHWGLAEIIAKYNHADINLVRPRIASIHSYELKQSISRFGLHTIEQILPVRSHGSKRSRHQESITV